jgi:choline kinase
VYVVKPPKQLREEKVDGSTAATPKRRPMNLLLRIYGPQVEHLIDRGEELAILKRLARKKIGPRMLGTFLNGRFEEYLHAKTLEAQDLRVSETSKQVAKRMRELHDGIELLNAEIESGPTTFLNWDKWVDRCETVITWLDKQVHDADAGKEPKPKAKYTRLGLICGVEWPVFRQTYDRYRAQLLKECGGESGIRKKLVFAHNDTQYGNLMRLQPAGESPLLQPSNQHKQLVVIDFEYAGQNTAGYEFVNHFSEWTYNYHHAEKPFACNHKQYPKPEEQRRFVRSYVMHRPQFNPSASATPKMDGREKTNISDFMLDARAPPGGAGSDYDAEEKAREKKMEKDIERLLHETRLWRIACSASWVAWGIVQAKVPELDEPPRKSIASSVIDKVKATLHPQSDPMDEEEREHKEDAKHDRPEGRAQEEAHHEGDEEQDDEFDYLAYAQERAMFFWGDCLQMGLVKDEDMPEGTRKMLKTVPY